MYGFNNCVTNQRISNFLNQQARNQAQAARFHRHSY